MLGGGGFNCNERKKYKLFLFLQKCDIYICGLLYTICTENTIKMSLCHKKLDSFFFCMSRYRVNCHRSRDLASSRPACLFDSQFPENLSFGKAKIFFSWEHPFRTGKNIFEKFSIINLLCQWPYIFLTNHPLKLKWTLPFWHKRLINEIGIRIPSSWVTKSGRAELLWMLFRTGFFEILAKTLPQGVSSRRDDTYEDNLRKKHIKVNLDMTDYCTTDFCI